MELSCHPVKSTAKCCYFISFWSFRYTRGEIPGPDDSRVRIATRMMYGDLLLRAMVDRPQLAALDEAGRAEESRFVVAMLLLTIAYFALRLRR
mgnify:CR=1 FL=1